MSHQDDHFTPHGPTASNISDGMKTLTHIIIRYLDSRENIASFSLQLIRFVE